jgi:phenylalanyl-tRNA synthetase beta chain
MGVVSNGMLCSGDELRLTADADGILILPADTPLGAPMAELFGDVVLDVDVKPNRGDALSIVGLRPRGFGRDRRDLCASLDRAAANRADPTAERLTSTSRSGPVPAVRRPWVAA